MLSTLAALIGVTTDAYRHLTSTAIQTAGVHGLGYYVIISDSCQTGSQADLHEIRAFIVRIVRAADGHIAALVLGPVPSGRTFTFVTPDHHSHRVNFRD